MRTSCTMANYKLFFLIIAIFVISLLGCSKNTWSKYWPYTNINPNKIQKQLPNHYEECLTYLDIILKDEAKQYFKDQDSSIAVREISDQIGGFFVQNWYLYYFTEKYPDLNTLMSLPPRAPGVARLFTKAGIADPKAMMRVIFGCYFRKLNGLTYNWETEIEKVKAYWPNQPDPTLMYQVRQEVMEKEWTLSHKFFFDRLNENDSVIILYQKPPRIFDKKPSAYYLMGIVNFKRPNLENINVRITGIISNKGTQEMLWGNEILQIGDTLTGNAIDWHKTSSKYFDYLQNSMYPNKLP